MTLRASNMLFTLSAQFRAASAGAFSGSSAGTATRFESGAGVVPSFGPGRTLIMLIDSPAGVSGDNIVGAACDSSTGWAIDIVTGVIYVIAKPGSLSSPGITLPINGDRRNAIAVSVPANGTSALRWTNNGSTITTSAAVTWVAPSGTAKFRIGNDPLGGGTWIPCRHPILAIAVLSRELSDAELTAATALNTTTSYDRNALPSWLTDDPACTFYWSAFHDWDGVSATSTSRGSSPITFTRQGTIPYNDLSEKIVPVSDTDFNDRFYSADSSIGSKRNDSASVQIVTTATRVAVDFDWDAGNAWSGVAAKVGATGYLLAANPSSVGQRLCIQLPTLAAGSKTIDIIDGLEQLGTPLPVGAWVRAIRVPLADSFTIVRAPPPTRRAVVYGDSISVGGNATNPMTEGFAALMRTDFPGRVSQEGWGSRSLYADIITTFGSAGALADRLVLALEGTVANDVVIEIGTNDYYFNQAAVSVFATNYGALLDAIRARHATCRIWCIRMIPRVPPATEAANGHGDTLGDYRTAISNAVAARAGWAVPPTVIDGGAWTIAMDGDGVHPTTAGHATYKANLKTAMGY